MSWFSKAVKQFDEKVRKGTGNNSKIALSHSFLTGNPIQINMASALEHRNAIREYKSRKADGKSNRLYDVYAEHTGSRSAAAILDPAGAYDKKKAKERLAVKEAKEAQDQYYADQNDFIQYQKDQAAKIAADKDSAEAKAAALEADNLRRKRAGMSSTNQTMDPSTGQPIMMAQPFIKRKSVGRGTGYWA